MHDLQLDCTNNFYIRNSLPAEAYKGHTDVEQEVGDAPALKTHWNAAVSLALAHFDENIYDIFKQNHILSTCRTATFFPDMSMIGQQSKLLVVNPVISSIFRLKFGWRYASSTFMQHPSSPQVGCNLVFGPGDRTPKPTTDNWFPAGLITWSKTMASLIYSTRVRPIPLNPYWLPFSQHISLQWITDATVKVKHAHATNDIGGSETVWRSVYSTCNGAACWFGYLFQHLFLQFLHQIWQPAQGH